MAELASSEPESALRHSDRSHFSLYVMLQQNVINGGTNPPSASSGELVDESLRADTFPKLNIEGE
ncbi:hypothetical protein [Sphingopyxis sp.]|uniref:hypothetical protein n=1 Tax=Sphingopyxis sp. TaxID=1908224 RepID=UPI002D77DF14|nr:hypothetical protein [Sphingopyxis sp.]HET6526092.1 hypothetical protein [Sphingopyxis sp.]